MHILKLRLSFSPSTERIVLNERFCSKEAIVFEVSDAILNERMYTTEAIVFRGSDLAQKKQYCSQAGRRRFNFTTMHRPHFTLPTITKATVFCKRIRENSYPRLSIARGEEAASKHDSYSFIPIKFKIVGKQLKTPGTSFSVVIITRLLVGCIFSLVMIAGLIIFS